MTPFNHSNAREVQYKVKQQNNAQSIEKCQILCYNISTVGLGPAKSTVWKESMRFFDFIEGKLENDKLGVL